MDDDNLRSLLGLVIESVGGSVEITDEAVRSWTIGDKVIALSYDATKEAYVVNLQTQEDINEYTEDQATD